MDQTQDMNSGYFMELLRRVLKYLIEGFVVAIAAYYIPSRRLQLSEIAMIGLSAAAIFAILDIFAPSIGAGARTGAGMGIGFNMVGFPAAVPAF
ncbi:MAG: hypothetical protein WD512_20985 [Candidatus Paceibacterota bacterium]|jgi:hypothetical protein